MNAEEKYTRLIAKYQSLIKEQTRIINRISNFRLAVFLAGAGLGIYLLVMKHYGLLVSDIIIFLALFIYLVTVHERYYQRRKYYEALLKVNEDSLLRIQGKWQSFPDSGREFADDSHPYSQDLDIFGQGSLFQFINTAVTLRGRQKLRDFLSLTPQQLEEISARQEATSDLAAKLDFRQQLTAEGLLADKMADPKDLIAWGKSRMPFYRRPEIKLALRALPAVTVIFGILTVISPNIQYYGLVFLLLLQLLLLKMKNKARGQSLELTHRHCRALTAYSRMLKAIESEKFASPYLKRLQEKLQDPEGCPSWKQTEKLAKITDNISNRQNPFYIIFNILFLLDYQFMFALENWKEKSGQHLEDWLDVLAEFEALSSLALVQHDYPQWAMPEFIQGRPRFAAEEMSHPLIKDGVANDLKFEPPVNILLITGSNMSGKSTLLRTAGINLVLAYAGTAVCAKSFSCSLMAVYTCMRISDNLEKNISSFYAELFRIKMIVQAAAEGREIFFLLDEIFKGTNSIDRHTGAKALVKKLSRQKVLGLISTHDLELGDLAGESKKIKNYHFQEFYKNNQIYFDYILRPGISTTRNAAYLMRLAGIEIEE